MDPPLAHLSTWCRATPSRRGGVLTITLLLYVAGSLWPFVPQPPARVHNGARWTEEGTLRFASPGLAVTREAPSWEPAGRSTNQLRIKLRARSFAPRQRGPAGLLTLARNAYAQNLALGQTGEDLVVRLRTACWGDRPREDEGCRHELRIRGIFATADWVDITLAIGPGRMQLRVGDRLPVELLLPSNALRSWAVEQSFALGNDTSGDHPWLGEIGAASAETPYGTTDCLDPTALELPETFWLLSREPKLVPFRDVPPGDMAGNLLLYIPLGMIFAWRAKPGRRQGVLLSLAFVAVTSLVLETSQLFVQGRHPSVTDTILNTAGGTLGAAVVLFGNRLGRLAAVRLGLRRRAAGEDRQRSLRQGRRCGRTPHGPQAS
jgi:VanZ like family